MIPRPDHRSRCRNPRRVSAAYRNLRASRRVSTTWLRERGVTPSCGGAPCKAWVVRGSGSTWLARIWVRITNTNQPTGIVNKGSVRPGPGVRRGRSAGIVTSSARDGQRAGHAAARTLSAPYEDRSQHSGSRRRGPTAEAHPRTSCVHATRRMLLARRCGSPHRSPGRPARDASTRHPSRIQGEIGSCDTSVGVSQELVFR